MKSLIAALSFALVVVSGAQLLSASTVEAAIPHALSNVAALVADGQAIDVDSAVLIMPETIIIEHRPGRAVSSINQVATDCTFEARALLQGPQAQRVRGFCGGGL